MNNIEMLRVVAICAPMGLSVIISLYVLYKLWVLHNDPYVCIKPIIVVMSLLLMSFVFAVI